MDKKTNKIEVDHGSIQNNRTNDNELSVNNWFSRLRANRPPLRASATIPSGQIVPPQVLPNQKRQSVGEIKKHKKTNIAESLFSLHKSLPDDVQREFLQELQNNHSEELNEENNAQNGNRTEEDQKRAIEIYDAYRDDVRKRQLSNNENYDKTILTLSSSGLALSLTAIKFAIPLATASHLFLIQGSWWLFGITIFISIIAYWVSNKALDIQLENAEDYYSKGIEDAFSKKNWYSDINDLLNMAAGVTFIIATAFIISFVTFNIN